MRATYTANRASSVAALNINKIETIFFSNCFNFFFNFFFWIGAEGPLDKLVAQGLTHLEAH